MATIITSECINCGACEPECPNTAIYGGGVAWEVNGETHNAIAQDIYYIVPSKCTECVGFYDHEACAAVCPVDCCIPDPNNLESESVLFERAKVLHPEKSFEADFPSRFKKAAGAENGASPQPESKPSEATDGAQAPAAAAPAPKPVPAQAPAPVSAAAAAPVAMLKLPRDVGTLPGPIEEKNFPGELQEDFDTVLAQVDNTAMNTAPIPVQIALRLAEPILGAMPNGVKARLEAAVGNPAAFSRSRSTALNIILNLILYPALLLAVAVMRGDSLFSQAASGWIMLGLLVAVVETCWRLREGIFHARPASELIYRASIYGIALAPLGRMLARGSHMGRSSRKVAFDGYQTDLHDDKLERDRRYGTVYSVTEHPNAFMVRLEMPRKIPMSSLKRLWNLPDEMPDYEYNIALSDAVLTISAGVRGEALRRLSYISPSFPSDFSTRIEFPEPVYTFKHRLRDKVLEVIVLKGEAEKVSNAA
jgi:ferredoxin